MSKIILRLLMLLFGCIVTTNEGAQSSPISSVNTGAGNNNWALSGNGGQATQADVQTLGRAKPQPIPQAQRATIEKKFGKLPISFEANLGQADQSVNFVARGSGYGLVLSGQEAVLALGASSPHAQPEAVGNRQSGKTRLAPPSRTDVVRMQLRGANPDATSEGVDLLPGKANYYIGNDPSKWRAGIPTYSKVRFSGVYRGVDLVYYGNQSQLEYDFVVAPHTDPNAIRLHFAGARKLALTADGDLAISAKNGQIAFHKPVVYQQVDGQRQPVEGRFALRVGNTVGFTLGSYDRDRPLVIDPVLLYSTYLSGGTPSGIALDAAGNIYLAGSGGFPVTRKASIKTASNGFVAAMNPAGTALIYATYIGGNGSGYPDPYSTGTEGDEILALAVSPAGYAYVVGAAMSYDFPVTPGAPQSAHLSGPTAPDGFVTKLYPAGTIAYSTYLGGSGFAYWSSLGGMVFGGDSANGIAIDSAGNAYVTGSTKSADFPITPGAFQAVYRGGGDSGYYGNAFVTKLNAKGTALLYSSYLGGTGNDAGGAIAVDNSGNAYVAGGTGSTDFPITAGAFQTTANSNSGFVTKVNPTGSNLIYSTYLGGSSGSGVSAIAVDASGSAYVTGSTGDADFPVTPGAFQTVSHGGSAFVTRLNPSGSALVYSTFLGGSGGDGASAIVLDSSGDAVVVGSAQSTDFPVTPGAFQTVNRGGYDAFITKLNPAGTALLYSTYLGGGGSDSANAIALDKDGNPIVFGYSTSSDFPITVGAFEPAYQWGAYTSYSFLTKLLPDSTDARKATTTTLTSSDPAATYGDQIMLTAKVEGGGTSSVPSGYVAFFIPSNPIGRAQLNSEGTASLLLSTSNQPRPFSGSTYQIQANYGGDPLFTPSSGGTTQTVSDVAIPVLSDPSGKHVGPLLLTITDASPNAVIHYTLDGTIPGGGSPVYSSPILISSGYVTVTAIAIENEVAQSGWYAQATYSILAQAAAPAISPAPGSYPVGQTVTITDANASATIRYTTDGSNPTTHSNWYHGPIKLTGAETINAIAIATGEAASPMATATFTTTGP